MKWGKFAIGIIVMGFLGVGSALALVEAGKQHFNHPGPLASTEFFEIREGADAGKVGKDLAAKGIIAPFLMLPAELLFKEGAKRSGRAQSIRHGTFEIPTAASMAQILDVITSGETSRPRFRVQLTASATGGKISLGERQAGQTNFVEILTVMADETLPNDLLTIADRESSIGFWVSIPEGLTSWQVVKSLELANFLAGDSGEVPAEGSLAPDTYNVVHGRSRQSLLAEMQAAQAEILAGEWQQKSDNLPLESAADALILASIVEKETSVAAERGLVASVFVNRLQEGMLLQTDPSVIYGITEGREPLGRGLRQSELKRDTPFNTYLHRGLPPSPIANPGRLSIRAALNPDNSDYLFFVADGKGGHAFAVTYAEHRKNVRAWRQVESGSAGNN